MTNIPLLLRLVNETFTTTAFAGGIVRRVLKGGNLSIIDKGIDDLQTKADRAAQQYITSRIQSQFPKVSIVGEEGEGLSENLDGLLTEDQNSIKESICFPANVTANYNNVPEFLRNIKEEDMVVWIDPLDGTREFTQGLVSHTTMLVGIAHDGKAVAGVIHQPFYKESETGNWIGRTIWGIPGVGNGGIELVKTPSNKRIITTTRSRSNKELEDALKSLNPDDILRVGGAGHKAIMLIEGKAHAYVYTSPGAKKWDICGPEAILRSFGGKFTDIDGVPYLYHKNVNHVNERGVLATAPGEDHEWYASKLTVVPRANL